MFQFPELVDPGQLFDVSVLGFLLRGYDYDVHRPIEKKLPYTSMGLSTNSADFCLVRHGLVVLASEWAQKKCRMIESDSVCERLRQHSSFMAMIPMSPIEMRVPGLSVFGARMLEAAGLTFDQAEATVQNAVIPAWRVSDPVALSFYSKQYLLDRSKLQYFLLAPGKVDRAVFEEWLPAPGAAGDDGNGGYDIAQGHGYGLVGFHEAEAHEELGKYGNAVEAAEVLMTRFP